MPKSLGNHLNFNLERKRYGLQSNNIEVAFLFVFDYHSPYSSVIALLHWIAMMQVCMLLMRIVHIYTLIYFV